VDSMSYLVSAALIVQVRANLDPPADSDRPPRHLVADIGEGLRYLWREPVIRSMSLAGFGLNLSAGGVFGLLVVYADQALKMTVPDRRIGLLYAAAAVGSLAAALLLPRVSRRVGPGLVSVIAYALFAGAVLGLAAYPLVVVALPLWAVWEVARASANMNGLTVRQQLTPDELQGRVNTTGRMIAWGGTPFGALLGGTVAEFAGVWVAYLALAVPVTIGLAVLYLSPVRRLRAIPHPSVAE